MTKNDASARDRSPSPLLAALVWALAAALFALTGWFYGLQPLAIALGNWTLARDYMVVQAKVATRTDKAPDGATISWPAASYDVNGKTYFAERLSVLDDDSPDEAYNSRVMRWLESATRNNNGIIDVYVSPRRPEIALVSNDLPFPSLMSRVPLALGFALLAIVATLGAVGALGNFGYYRRLANTRGGWALTAALCGLIFPLMLHVGTDADSGEFTVDFVVFLTAIAALFLYAVCTNTLEKGAGDDKADGILKRAGLGRRKDADAGKG